MHSVSTLCLIVLLCFAFYIMIHYSYIYIRLYTLNTNSIKINLYKKSDLQILFLKAIDVLQKNANIVAHPYFYNESISSILDRFPSYINVLNLCKFIVLNDDSKNDLNDILIENYGVRYQLSPNLNILVSVTTSEYGVDEHFHYLLEDIEKSTIIYLHNRKYIDNKLLNYVS